MYYKNGQVLNDRQENLGEPWSYTISHTPRYMNPASRYTTGVITQQAICNKLNHKVAIRSPQYTSKERQKGSAGIIEGRNRFRRSLSLLNDVQHETNCFPEPMDLLHVHNRDDFNTDEKHIAAQEPLIVFEWLEGYTLDRFGSRKGKSALYDSSNRYWFQKKVEQIDEDKRIHQVDLNRLSKLIRALGIHSRNLLRNHVVHIDIKPEHVLILFKDEVPRLLGIGHLAPLDQQFKLSPNDPVHAFTTAGYSAPELMSADTWDQALDGEALMLYSLGAIALSIMYTGPQADLSQIWRTQGRAGIETLLQRLHEQSQQANAKKRHFVQLLSALLDPNPQQRKAKCTLAQLIHDLDPFNEQGISSPSWSERQQQANPSLLSSY